MKKKICVVTGSRAEYGLLSPLMRELKKDSLFKLQIIVTGMHLSPDFGLTYKEIEKDGFHINEKVETLLSGDDRVSTTKSIGLGVLGFPDIYRGLAPNLIILLGDRLETFAAAVAALVARIPIAHLHGGELTEGMIDDAIRHSITKMSLFHFVSTEDYRKRVIQLGESPERVFNVGAIGIDNIKQAKFLSKPDLEKELGIELSSKVLLITYHPVTLENNTSGKQTRELLKALDRFPEVKLVFTKPNADTNNRIITELIERYVKDRPRRAVLVSSLGQTTYLSMVKHSAAVVGNSSSGIIEVPFLGKPTVNIGDRQRGRLAAESIIHCSPVREEIESAIAKALSDQFARLCNKVSNPYGMGNAASKIVGILKNQLGKPLDIKKSFFNIICENNSSQ